MFNVSYVENENMLIEMLEGPALGHQCQVVGENYILWSAEASGLYRNVF